MKFGRKFIAAAFLLLQFLPQSAPAFVLLPEPPASGFTMNLDLEPSVPFQSIGYGITTWNKLAEMAIATWNAAGIGSGPDFGFLRVANPPAVGNPCARDGINEVRWSPDNCGFSFGDVIAITIRWIVNGLRVEEDVLFNSNLPFDAYRGPLRYSNGHWLNDFHRVAVHEFGHVVGLDHPNAAGQKVTAIMNSHMSNVDWLQPDDIAGARAIAWSAASDPQLSSVTLIFNVGWNLAGNGSTGTLDAASAFGNSSDVLSVWKWLSVEAKWALYSPSLTRQQLANYANTNGHAVLTTINSGEGFWVNASRTFAARLPPGTAISSASFQSARAGGWRLVATGDNKTPRDIGSPYLSTLWAWDAVKAKWYFYAPSLDAKGGTYLSDYITSKGYLDFGTKTLDPTTGFWVNQP
ncbi:MAG: matrixin family metalloprotease [Betaproteobacteria bacterium]|nr:matrixin family metalloprotease [Betaproteobacteria bacterium]